MKQKKTLILTLFGTLMLCGCPNDGAAENAGEKIDEAADEVEDAVDDAADEID